MVMRSKFDNSSISMKEVVVTSIFFSFLFFFEGGGWSRLKFNNLGLALSIALKFYKMVAKELTLKVRKFLGLLPTFVDVIGEKTGRELFGSFPILNRANDFPAGCRMELYSFPEGFSHLTKAE